jgi:hypothetical protein
MGQKSGSGKVDDLFRLKEVLFKVIGQRVDSGLLERFELFAKIASLEVKNPVGQRVPVFF